MPETRPTRSARFPTKDAVLEFIRESPLPVGKREIARAFHLTGADRIQLKALLKELERDGAIERGHGRRVASPAALPEVAVLVIADVDADGEVLARPLNWDATELPPRIYMQPEPRGHAALQRGDRVLARLSRRAERDYVGRVLRRLDSAPGQILGVYQKTADGGGRLRPTDRRQRAEFLVAPNNAGEARPGELVLADVLPATRLGLRQARVVERLGDLNAPRSVSLVSIHAFGIPTEFPAAALAEAERALAPTLDGRVDLRDLPLVTIDGADARDFDDAVWAERDAESADGGWHLVVAIADVAAYVRPGGPLDRAAYERGNSCYFPDRVVPMLPEALSNELCSLKPGVDRACLAAHLWIDAHGTLRRHQFERGLMRSAARLTYEQVQAARNGEPDAAAAPLVDAVVAPLYGAYAALAEARSRRGTLDLDLPERQVRLASDGRVEAIAVRPRLDSHRLIEEFMIAANVAAAEALEARHRPCLYRVHDRPTPDKLEALREFLGSLGYNLAKGQVIRPTSFTQILRKAHDTPESTMISEVVLRSQAQAFYSPDNLGHFGLALPRYAHFTSPIRRYADLVVHRALIGAYDLGPGGLDDEAAGRLAEIGEHISGTERRAAAAERDAVDRHTASYLASRVGASFSGHISGVTRFGLFVTLAETGADGLIPISTLPNDFYEHQERQHALVGRRWGRVYRLGAPATVELVEADPVVGSLVFRLLDTDEPERSQDPLRHPRASAGKRHGGRSATGGKIERNPRRRGSSRPR